MTAPGEAAAAFLKRCTVPLTHPNTRITIAEWGRRANEWAERANLPGRPTEAELCAAALQLRRGPARRHWKTWLSASDVRLSYRGRA